MRSLQILLLSAELTLARSSLRKRHPHNVSLLRHRPAVYITTITGRFTLNCTAIDCRLNVRRDMSEKLMAPPGSDLIFGSLSIFRRTQREPELESEGTPEPEGVIEFGGESQSTVDGEV